MATRKQIQSALEKPYNRILFAKEVLHPVFSSSFKLLGSPSKPHVDPTKSQGAVIENVCIYATIKLDDETDITCYEVLLQPSVRIEQSKVAIQQYVRNLLIPGQAALINFVSPVNKDMWRFTLVARDSKITDEGIKETQTHPQRYTYLVEKDRPNRTMAERMEVLSLSPEKNLQTLIDTFSVERMSKAFFAEYKEHYQNFVEYLTGKRLVKSGSKWEEKQTAQPSPFLQSVFNGDEKKARDFIKKLMGRIVFLYFVQKKRWLGASTTEYIDGPYDFIYQLFKKTGGDENFFPIGLSTLFFEALNQQRPDDDWNTPWGETVKIPFLNGGLFVRDDIDEIIHRKGDLLIFPARLFSDIEKMEQPVERGFLDFLNAYNFTVYEDSMDDQTVAVDPEMLGHIFENLLEDNKDKGAFYTPKEIVHYMCQESLTEYLVTNSSPDKGTSPESFQKPENSSPDKGTSPESFQKPENSSPDKGRWHEVPEGLINPNQKESPQGEKIMNLPHLKTFRKELRNNLTPAEATLWKMLQGKKLEGRKFRRQHSVANYILDFYCPSEKLAVELDGEVHNNPAAAEYDYERDLFLQTYGIKVIRFENKEVFEQPENVLETIRSEFGWEKKNPPRTPVTDTPPLEGDSTTPSLRDTPPLEGDSTTPSLRDTPPLEGGELMREQIELLVKEKEISKLTAKQLKHIDELLDNVKICDPAIGSGAFPMGLLQEIFTLKELIFYHLNSSPDKGRWPEAGGVNSPSQKELAHSAEGVAGGVNSPSQKELAHSAGGLGFEPARVKENIIQNSIYGVDIEKGAVDIARLRFWLSLVVDEEHPRALPNLDYKIVVGNSLVSKFEDEIIEIDWDVKPARQTEIFSNEQALKRRDLLQQISQLQKHFFDPENSEDKDKLKSDIRNLKIDILINQLQLMINATGQHEEPKRINFKRASAFTKAMKKFLESKGWEQTIKKLQAAKLPSSGGGVSRQMSGRGGFEHFDWKLDFPEVLNPIVVGENGGFDIVIANPPYLKERDNAHIFNSVNVSRMGRLYHQGKMDYWYYFLHLAMDISSPNSAISFITSRYWINSQGAKKLISRVQEMLSFVSVIDIGKLKVFDNVAGHHMITVYSKSTRSTFLYKNLSNDISLISNDEESDFLSISKLQNNEVFRNDNIIFAKPILSNSKKTVPLGELYVTSIGVQESVDKISRKQIEKQPLDGMFPGKGVFVLSSDELNNLKLTKPERGLIKKYLDPNDVSRYCIAPISSKFLIYSDKSARLSIENDIPFSNIRQHLEQHSAYITSSNKPFGLHRSRDAKYFERPKIIFKGMFVEPEFTIDESGYYFGFSFTSIIEKGGNSLKFLLAILNSSFAKKWFYTNGKQRGAGVDIGVEKLRLFPIAKTDKTTLFEGLVTQILDNKAAGNDTTALEQEIDNLVYRLYDLSYEEVKVIDPAFALTKEEYENIKLE